VKKAINKHAKYTTTKLDRSRPVKKGAVTRRQLGEQVAVNMHTMGTSCVGKVRDVRQIAEAQIGKGVADIVEFEAQVSGHESTEKANRIQARQGLLDWQFADRFNRDRPVLLLPGSWWSGQHEPQFESTGWWQKPTRQVWCKQCARCGIVKEYGKDFHKMRWRVLSVQRREPNDESNPTAAIDWHDFYQCRPEVCWQIRRQEMW